MTREEAQFIFESKIKARLIIDNRTNCWEFMGAWCGAGYGHLRAHDKNIMVHRISYLTFLGEILEDLCICHHCDNRICCNPDHLFLATKQENLQDAVNKHRMHGGYKLSDENVLEIKRRLQKPYNGIQQELAEEFNISFQMISLIKLGKRYADLI